MYCAILGKCIASADQVGRPGASLCPRWGMPDACPRGAARDSRSRDPLALATPGGLAHAARPQRALACLVRPPPPPRPTPLAPKRLVCPIS